VSVAGGLFTVQLNDGGQFGASAFNGDARWLEIAVRCPAGSGDCTSLSRQALAAAPYARYAPQAGTANTATTASSAPWSGLTGVPAAAGDTSGTYPNLTVTGIQGRFVSATAPTSGQTLKWNGCD
jgi:hypothetical protein